MSAQRFFDILLSTFAILFLSPLMIPLMLILRVTGEGDVFFLQSRVGRMQKDFTLYKFATMLRDSPNMGTGTVTIQNDPRVLPLGAILRKTKVNELPQLFNVLKGDMSIVGPRPQTRRCFDSFPLTSRGAIQKVKPGLSGIGSVVFRNEELMMAMSSNPERFYDEVIMPYKGRLESWYVENQNIDNYFSTIFFTVLAMSNRSTDLIFKYHPTLPRPPLELEPFINSDYYE